MLGLTRLRREFCCLSWATCTHYFVLPCPVFVDNAAHWIQLAVVLRSYHEGCCVVCIAGGGTMFDGGAGRCLQTHGWSARPPQ
jgi:hypothetical protein